MLVQAEELKGKIRGTELAQILQPNPGAAPATEDSSGQKRIQYKPNEGFHTARKKACPWYRVSDTSVTPEDVSAIWDYLTSSGTFSDVVTPIMFLKKILCLETYRSLSRANSKARPSLWTGNPTPC